MTKSTWMSHSLAVAILTNCLAGTSGAQETGASTSVTRELERLFNEGGQAMPSMKMQDLPYATTPQVDRVRKRDEGAPAPRFKLPGIPSLPTLRNSTGARPAAKKPGLLGRMFGRFSRKAPESEPVAPSAGGELPAVPSPSDPPAIVYGPHRTRMSQPETVSLAAPATQIHAASRARGSERVVRGPTREADLSRPVNVDPQSMNGSTTRIPVTEVSSRREQIARGDGSQSFAPLSTEPVDRSGTVRPPVREVDPVWIDFSNSGSNSGFSNPFSGEEVVNDGESLDRDAFTDLTEFAPVDLAGPPSQQSTEETGEVDIVGNVRESNPFTGSRIDADDFETFDAAKKLPADEVTCEPGSASEVDQRSDWRHSLIESRRTARVHAVREELGAAPLGAADSYRLRGEYQEQLHDRRHLTGFQGFCPVALRDRQELIEASDQFRAQFGLHAYFFSTAEAKAEFERNPTRYVPVVGGADVVALINSGEEQPGSLRFSRWHRDRLYLFQSRETMALFSLDPDRFANEY